MLQTSAGPGMRESLELAHIPVVPQSGPPTAPHVPLTLTKPSLQASHTRALSEHVRQLLSVQGMQAPLPFGP